MVHIMYTLFNAYFLAIQMTTYIYRLYNIQCDVSIIQRYKYTLDRLGKKFCAKIASA